MLTDIKSLDELMKRLLELYLEYLQQWILSLQKESKASRTQKTILEDEWKTMMMLCGERTSRQFYLFLLRWVYFGFV